MIRAGRGGAHAADWLDRNVIGIGWDFDGADIVNMSRKQTREARQAHRLPGLDIVGALPATAIR